MDLKNLKSFIEKTLSTACIYFSIITLIYSFIVALIFPEADEILLEGTRIFFFFLFSLMFSCANSLLATKSFPSFPRHLLHYFITVFAFLLCILLPATNAKTGASFIVVGLSAFTLVYLFILVIISVIKSSVAKRRNKKEAYENLFHSKK